MMILRESGQLITSVVLERSGLPVMPTNRVIPVIQVITVVTMLVTMKSMIIDVNDDQMIRRSTPPLLPPHPSCQSPCQADSRWPPSPQPSPSSRTNYAMLKNGIIKCPCQHHHHHHVPIIILQWWSWSKGERPPPWPIQLLDPPRPFPLTGETLQSHRLKKWFLLRPVLI